VRTRSLRERPKLRVVVVTPLLLSFGSEQTPRQNKTKADRGEKKTIQALPPLSKLPQPPTTTPHKNKRQAFSTKTGGSKPIRVNHPLLLARHRRAAALTTTTTPHKAARVAAACVSQSKQANQRQQQQQRAGFARLVIHPSVID